jgi:transcription antitermination factor NusG
MADYRNGQDVKITGGYYKGERGKIAYKHSNGKYAVNIPSRHTLVENVPTKWLKSA